MDKSICNTNSIRGKNTKPEELVRKHLFSKGFRYRKNDARLPGKPDIVLPKYKTAIFVNGCFWHAHESCRYFVCQKDHRMPLEQLIGKRVLALYRVSSDKQLYRHENDEADIPMQRERCRGHSELMGWEIVCELQEEGVSGHKVRAENRDKGLFLSEPK